MTPAERIAEINGFLGFVKERWPVLGPQVADQLAPRCSRCILSDKFVPLKDGVCQFCRENRFDNTSASNGADPQAQAELTEILNSHAGRGAGDYDAVVLFSGGKDSAYLLHRLTTEFPDLRLAALTVDNGFMSSVALENARTIFRKLENIDHYFLRPKKGLFARAFHHALTNLGGKGCYEKVDRMDGDLVFDIGRNFTATLNAPIMISGLSSEQVERILGLTRFEAAEDLPRTHSAGFELSELYDEDERQRYWWNPDRWPATRRPRVLHPFHAWHYDEDFIPKEVVRLGLIEAGQDNPLVTNNDTIPVMLAVDSVNLGYSSFEPEFAQLVRQGRADRATWLAIFQATEYLSARGEFLPRSVSETLQRLDLTAAQVGLPELKLG